jgi:hypothetical protein
LFQFSGLESLVSQLGGSLVDVSGVTHGDESSGSSTMLDSLAEPPKLVLVVGTDCHMLQLQHIGSLPNGISGKPVQMSGGNLW